MLALWCKSEWEKGKTWLRSKKLVTWGDLMPTGDISIAKRNLHNDKVLPFYPAVSLGSPICCGSYGLSIIDWVNWETFFKTLLMWPRLMMIQTQCYLMIGRWDGGRATGWRVNASGDTLLWDIQGILGKPIIVLARQAQPTHDQSDILGSARQT